MRLIITDTAQGVAQRAADIYGRLLAATPTATLGLATGDTPLALYRELVARHRRGEISFARAHSFNLDEYIGLAPDHPQSYRRFMDEQLFAHIDLPGAHTHVPDGLADPDREGERYEAAIRAAGGIDLQLLGVGRNGHIGFNEPTSSLGSHTRPKTLTRDTVAANGRFFAADEFQPRLAMTMGIGTILDARRILLLATGRAKATAVRALVEGPVSAMVPASALQMHPRVTVIVDREAAAELTEIDYYLWIETQRAALAKGATA